MLVNKHTYQTATLQAQPLTCIEDFNSENALMSPKLSTRAVMKKHSQMKLNFTLFDDAEAMDLSG